MSNEELVIRIKAGIDTADNMLLLWQQNRHFIYSIAQRYRGRAEMEDLEQEGYLALYDAVEGYDPESGYKFLSYAGYWIRQRMCRYVQNNGTVRIPVHEGEKLDKYKKLINAYSIRLGRKPTRREIARNLGIIDKMVLDLEKATQMEKIGSLDSYVIGDDVICTIGEIIASEVDVEEDVLENVQQEQLKALIWPMVDALPERQRNILRARYQEGISQSAIGREQGVSYNAIRQIEQLALRNLRRSEHAGQLRLFLDVYSTGIAGNSVESFNRTWTSSTERAAMKLYEKIH